MSSYAYNPFTSNLDLVGSGASYIDGVVADSSLLPITLGTPALDAVYLAKAGSGVWLINRKPAGLYVRVANDGVAADWQYLGAFPEVNADGNWELYNSTDPTKELKFDLSGISTGTTRTISVPDKNITLDDAGDSRTPSSHASSHATAGSDPLAPSDIGAAASNHTHILATDIATALAEDPDLCRDSLGLGDMATSGSGDYSLVNHTHELTALAATGATNGHVLTAQGDGTAAFAAASGGGVTGAAASASDVLGVSGSDITGVDAGSDKIVFWDDSASELTYLTTVGPTFDGTTLRWPVELVIACSDETTNLTTGTAKVTFRAPYAFLLTGVRASVNTAPTGSTLIVDINNGANSALSTKLSIDASEKTSTTAATAAVIDTTYDDFSDDAEITIDIDQIGSTVAGKGLKVTLIGTRA